MKIGILTYHSPSNFGANLQAYSSFRYFKSLGHEVWTINYLPGGKNAKPMGIQDEAHWEFSQSALPVTRVVYDGKEIYEVVKELGIELVIIGSDAVWNKRNRQRLAIFHCSWLWNTDLEKSVRVAAMSPAFMGQNYYDLTAEEKESFRHSLTKFSFTDTRDEWTRHVINRDIMGEEYIKRLNPDPVFLLDEYADAAWEHPETIKSKEYIVVSLPKHLLHRQEILSPLRKMWNKQLLKAAHTKGYKVVELPLPGGKSDFTFDYTVPYPINPIQWYLWLKNAKGFFGDRFHAVVSCCSAGTSFLSYDSYGHTPGWVKALNLFGNHKYDSKYNYSSKIRNLLLGTGLEENRFTKTEICLVSPDVIMEKLLNFDYEKQAAFKSKSVDTFRNNMTEMLKIVTDERP